MAQGTTPTLQQRRLRAELRMAREDAGRTQVQVAGELAWSPNKVIRLETGLTPASTADAMALIHHAGIGAAAGLRRSEHDMYDQPSIGIITAMPIEFDAMRALIDNPVIKYAHGDDQVRYTLGTLPSVPGAPPHRVVLILLPRTATNAAAHGCTNMIRSYPQIRVIIMVGTAAGIPRVDQPAWHVRLGDIVVVEGIIEFDHLRVYPGHSRLRQPCPLPSVQLMCAVNDLRADEVRGERPWEDLLRTPALGGYVRPNERTDVVLNIDGDRLEHPRRTRTNHRPGFPKVHYGLVGSSDRSFRDVKSRDSIAAEHGLLAVEMEGAAVAVSSSLSGRDWFMVRGISDYGDSQRTEAWCRPAAQAAAAYVRAALGACPPLGRMNGGVTG